MAEKAGGIYYDVTLETGQMVEGQRKVDKSLNSIGDSADKLQTKLSAVGAAIAAMFAAGAIVGQLAKASEGAKQFEKAIDNLSAITGATGKDLEYLTKTAKEFGATTSASALQAVEAMKLIASAKPELLENAAALKAVTEQAVILADASGMTLPQAADSLTLALNQMGAGADQAGRFINVMAAGAKFGASEIAQSSEALKQFAVSAKGVGLSIEEANAGIQALAAVGVKGGEAGTALRNVLLKLETETDKKLKPSINGLAGALENLGKKNLDTASLTKMFGLENINAVNALIGSTDQVRLLTAQLTGTDTALEQAKTNTDNYAGSIKRMGNALENAYIEIGTKFNPALKEGADFITNLAVEVSNGSDRIDTAMSVIATAAVVAAGSLSGPLVIGLYSSVRAMSAATTAATVFSGVMSVLGGPVGIAITALGLLALNWDKVAGSAKTAAQISEESASRIARAQGQSSEKAAKDLRSQLDDARKNLADVELKIADSSKGSIYGGTVGSSKEIADLKSRRDAYVSSISDINAAMSGLGGGGGRGKVNPATAVQESSGGSGTKTSTGKDGKFDSAGYLAGLKKNAVDAWSAITVAETEAMRKHDVLMKQGKISFSEYEQGKKDIAEAARIDRSEIMEKEFNDAVQKGEQRQAESDALAAKEAANEKRRQESRANAQLGTLYSRAQGGGLDEKEALTRGLAESEIASVEEARLLDIENSQIYADQKVAIEAEMNAKIEAMRAAANQSAMNSTADIFGSLVSITKNAAGEQSGIYQAMFAAQKAFSIASAIMAIHTGFAKAQELGFPANLGAMAGIASASAGLISTISGTNISGGRQYGGPVSAGSMYRVNETGAPEMFTASSGKQYMMPSKSGQVTAADKIGGGGDVQWSVIINNAPQGTTSSVDQSTRTVTVAVAEVANQIRSNSGPVWSALRGSTTTQSRL